MGRKRKLPPGLWERGGTYYARFRAGGRSVCKSLSRDLDIAKRKLNEMRVNADKNRLDMLDLDCPWQEARAAFLNWAKGNIRNPRDYERDLERFEAFVPIQNVRQITASHIDKYRAHRLDAGGVSPRTVNREVSTINNLLNKAADRFRMIDHNPIAGVKPLSHDALKKKRRSLTHEEIEELIKKSPEHLRPVWTMFARTGVRKSELVSLRFEDVDWPGRSITIRAEIAKGKRSREIPLDDEMMGELQRLRKEAWGREPVPGRTRKLTEQQAASFSAEHVFVTTANTPWRNNLLTRFYSYCKAAGIEGAKRGGSVDIHSLRVSSATLMLERGANPKAVQAILGHSTLTMTMNVYAKATDRSMRDAVALLSGTKASPPEGILAMHRDDKGAENRQNARAVASA
ncbi:MAG: tyrosine-type recombinase/integrase [Pirellulales bacterium]